MFQRWFPEDSFSCFQESASASVCQAKQNHNIMHQNMWVRQTKSNLLPFLPPCTDIVPSSLSIPLLLSCFTYLFIFLLTQPFSLWNTSFPAALHSVLTSSIHHLILLCTCSAFLAFFTYLSPPLLLPHLPQGDVHSPPGSRCSSGTGCWSHRGGGWATSGRVGSVSCPGWPADCGRGASGQAQAGWSPGQSRPLWHNPLDPLGWGPRRPPGPRPTAAGTHWPRVGAGLPSGLSLEGSTVRRRHANQANHIRSSTSGQFS